MDGQRFDRITRVLATGTTRRRAFAMIGAGLGAAIGGVARRHEAAAIDCPDGTICPGGSVCCEDGCGFTSNSSDCGCDHLECGACGFCAGGTCHPRPSGSTVCRPATGPCDQTEVCDGTSLDCPPDRIMPAGIFCRIGSQPCEDNALCNGVDVICPPNRLRPAGVLCRPSLGPCDVAESCTGTSPQCPTDQFRPAGTVCRAATGPCDEPDLCTGTFAGCPFNQFKPEGTVCREATGPCDVAEVCSGFSASCPSDVFQPAGTPCGDADVCNGLETCDGAGQCVAGDPLDCDDGDPCTSDTCVDGICVFDPIVCDDGNACTTNECDPVTGCVHNPIPGCCQGNGDCEDGNPCTVNRCQGNVCVTESVVCPDDGNPCTTNACIGGACQATLDPNNTSCGANGGCVDGICLECNHKREVFCVGQCRRKSDFNQDDRNCGACGHVCPVGMICKGGFCVRPTGKGKGGV